jgi:asparagine synthase (glutamine-hydrolysing)
MCGIAGRLTYGESIGNKEIVEQMCENMVHRGPDFGSVKSFGKIVLGHRRLKIIDLSEDANQPMTDETGRYTIVFNGEIYNFKELQSDLKRLGYNFQTSSDTEVLLAAFKEWGTLCLPKLNGMFAFAVWDNFKKSLFLARDRFGKKPLFYSNGNGKFSFASETKAMLKDPLISGTPCYEAVNCYLTLGYILNPLTMYSDVRQLEPGSYIIVSEDGNIIEKSRYWNYAELFRTKTALNKNEIIENIRGLLSASVKRRMISDVPVGAFLSGGIDSSSIVSVMKKFHQGDLHTFSVGFKQNSYNELPDADKVAEWAGTIHHGIVVDASDNISLLHKAIEVSDQLFSDNSIIPMIEVSKLASTEIKVVLSGDGADELFAGYITYTADNLLKRSKLIPLPLRHLLSSTSIRLNPFTKGKIDFDYKRQQFFNGSLFDYRKAHYLWRLIFNEEERIQILGEDHRELVYDTDPYRIFSKYYEEANDLEKLDQHLYVDVMTWLTDDILVKVDRSTMNSSIEARCPYLDIELASFVASIPASIKMKNGTKKYILKKALKGIVPDFVLTKKKSGFNAPVKNWLEATDSNEFKTYNRYVYNTAFINKKSFIHQT